MRGAALGLALVCMTHIASADDLDQARKAVAGSDYMAARPALVNALASGTAGPAELAEIYKLSGLVEAALGNDKEATANFAKWLRLDPKGTLPPGTSPKIMRPFDAAAASAKEPIKAKVETTSQPPTVTLIVTNDPDALIAKTRVFVVADGKPQQTLEGTGAIALPNGARLDLRVQALDAHGNRVVELGSAEVPIVITGGKVVVAKPVVIARPITHEAPAVAGRPAVLSWWLWGGVAVVFAGASTYFGLEARSETNQLSDFNAHSGDHTFTEATDLADKAKRNALFCNIGIGVAGAFAIGATILYLTEPRTETRISIAPTSNGGALVIGGSW
ncbi:MAG TPA: tetratricopeptide repeat protein [Kofleriaceae bacterium]